ncbi:2Fe-2S iron-sulfur cluster-binding protein [Chloroflexota bacterium]
MKPVSLTIDGRKIGAAGGEKLLRVARDNDIYIPNLCALPGHEPAACRLCFVEVAGKEYPVTACTELVTDGMVVDTRGEKALRLARSALELIMASHPVDCAHCASNGTCELQKIAHHLGVRLKSKRFRKIMRELPVDDSNRRFSYDPNKCVLCGRCVLVCREHLGILGFAHRGFERRVTTFGDEPIGDFPCHECGKCVIVCPTGALVFKKGKETETGVGDDVAAAPSV